MRNRAALLLILAAVLLMAKPRPTIASIFAEEFDRQLAEVGLTGEDPAILAARDDCNAFVEYCFGLTQAQLHRRLQAHWNEHERTVDLFPIEHGKTTQAVARMVWLLGKYPERQGAYVSSGDLPARKTVMAVARVIENNERVRRVFPNLRPEMVPGSTQRTCWGAEAIRVAGAPTTSLARDPSLAGFGYNGQITGSRLHWIFVDNVCNKQNTMSARVRDSALESLDNDVFSRVLPGGEIHITDTSWYDDDPPHVIGGRPAWSLHVEDAERGDLPGETLWPDQWPWERLRAKRDEIGSMAYDRTLRNITTSKSLGIFKREHWDTHYGSTPWLASIKERTGVVVTGVDLATRKEDMHDFTALVTAVQVGSERHLVHIRCERLDAGEIGRAILDCYRTHHATAQSSLIVVEDNGAQAYIVQMLRDAAMLEALGATKQEVNRIRVVGRTTTARKRDQELGIPGLATDIEMGRWKIAAHHETQRLWEDCRRWSPDEHSGDRLMAWWLCNEQLRSMRQPGVRLL